MCSLIQRNPMLFKDNIILDYLRKHNFYVFRSNYWQKEGGFLLLILFRFFFLFFLFFIIFTDTCGQFKWKSFIFLCNCTTKHQWKAKQAYNCKQKVSLALTVNENHLIVGYAHIHCVILWSVLHRNSKCFSHL